MTSPPVSTPHLLPPLRKSPQTPISSPNMYEHDDEHEDDEQLPTKIKKLKKKKRTLMKPSPSSSLYNQQQEMEEGVLAVGMDVDDTDPFDFLSEIDRPPVDADFFNSFEDDFDDENIN